MMANFRTSRGRPLPLGTSAAPDGVNFALLCRHGQSVHLVLLPPEGGTRPLAVVELDSRRNKTGDHWHVCVHDLPPTFSYGWRVDGPKGHQHRFDPTRLLLDPSAAVISNGESWAGTCETDPD